MLQDQSSNYPHTLAQWFYIVLAWFIGSGGAAALLTLWQKRRHGPAEVRKLEAETRSIIVRDDIALGETVSRLIKEVAQAALEAEERRQEWLLEQEQMRAKILFWRNKAEELDGQLIDSRQANGLLQARVKLRQDDLNKALAILSYEKISFQEAQDPEVRELVTRLEQWQAERES